MRHEHESNMNNPKHLAQPAGLLTCAFIQNQFRDYSRYNHLFQNLTTSIASNSKINCVPKVSTSVPKQSNP